MSSVLYDEPGPRTRAKTVIATLMGVVDTLVSQESYSTQPVFLGIVVGFLTLTIPLGLLLDLIERTQKKAVSR